MRAGAALVIIFLAGLAAKVHAADAPGVSAAEALASARQQFDAGNYSVAISTLEAAAAANPQDARLYFWIGRSYYELRDYKDASGEWERAIRLAPNNSEYHDWLGRAYGGDADNTHSFWMARKAREQFEEAVRLDGRNIPARRDLMEFYASAPWILGGSRDKAREQIAAITALDKVEGALAQALFYKDIKRLDQAEPYYRQVIQWKPHQIEPYFQVADYYARRSDAAHMKEAVNLAAAINPADARLPYYRGVLDVLEGSSPEAETYLKAYLARTPQRSDLPSHAQARMWLGILYEKTGRRLEAAEQFRAAMQLDPQLDYAKQSLERLEKQSN